MAQCDRSNNTDKQTDGISTGLTRREALQRGSVLGIAGGAALTGLTQTAGAQQAAKTKMPTAVLGRTGVKVSRLAMGGAWDVDSEVVGAGLEQGINYIDTAQVYNGGNSETAFGTILKQMGATGLSEARKKLWLVTKSPDVHNMETRLDRSLVKLQQDYVDCYYMHGIRDPKLPASSEIKAMAERMKKSGKTRFFGFSCHDDPLVECLNAAADSGFIDVIMFRYDYHYYKSDALNRAIDRCVKAKIGLVAMKTQVGAMTLPEKINPFLKRGVNQHQAAIKAVAIDARMTSICSEMVTADQMRQNASAIAGKLTVAEADAIQEHAQLVSHLWCRGCDHICRKASGAGSTVAVADSLRFLMYHDHYGKMEHARTLYAGLPEADRDPEAIANGDWAAAEQVCPHNVPLTKLMLRVKERLA